MDLLSAAAAFVNGDFVTTANSLGLEPGESLTLRMIKSELTTNALGASPFEAGRLAGRRICAYVVVPRVIARGRQVLGRLRGRPGPVVMDGSSPRNALTGKVLGEAVGADAGLPPDQLLLPGKWIQTANGPMQLGPKLGAGQFGNVYELPKNPNQVVKIGSDNGITPPSFPRQMTGTQLLKAAGIATPGVELATAAGGSPPILLMDNIFSKWPGARVLSDVGDLSGPQVQAVEGLFQQIGNKGLIWIDGKPSNVFLYEANGGLRAGVVDADMIFAAADWKAQPQAVQQNLVNVLMSAGKMSLILGGGPINANQIMQALFDLRYGGN